MSLRAQLTILTALSVAAAVIIASLVAYLATKDRLLAEVDDSLRARAQEVGDARDLPRHGPGEPDGQPARHDPFAPTDVFFQVIDTAGTVVAEPDSQQVQIPVSSADTAVAAGTQVSFMHDVTSNGLHLRVITNPGNPGQAVQVARSLAEVDASLSSLRQILVVVSGSGVALAAVLGLLVAQRSLRPVARLTKAAEHVAATQDLEHPIEVRRNDEVGRLARSFNDMLLALRESRRQQQQLVTDASHELRTPLTSLRTNIELLLRDDDLPQPERRELMSDVTFELEELTKLVGELVELASDERVDRGAFEDVRLDELAASVVERATRRSGLRIQLEAQPTLVSGNYNLLERAAWNLIDNACKWSPPDGSIDVTAAGGEFTVRDRGPGIPDADRSHVFDRFYRADAARSTPGSGLGLAIVKQIIEAHGGSVWVEPASGGGTTAAFRLSPIAMELDATPGARIAQAAASEQKGRS